MPLRIKPNPGEQEQPFISRCMGNPQMLSEFPEQETRAAVCYSTWRRAKGIKEELIRGNSVKAMRKNTGILIVRGYSPGLAQKVAEHLTGKNLSGGRLT